MIFVRNFLLFLFLPFSNKYKSLDLVCYKLSMVACTCLRIIWTSGKQNHLDSRVLESFGPAGVRIIWTS